MADSSTIKDFLVSLGFKVDEAGLKKFAGGLAATTKGVVGLAAAVETAAVAITTFVAKAASDLERLYFSAQRAGSTAENLSALQFGFRQIGLSAEAATATLENFRLSLLLNPAKEGLLHSFGIATRTLNGQMRDTKDLALDFAKKLGALPPWLAARWAEMFGISAQQLFQMQRNADELTRSELQYHELAKKFGVDLNSYAAESHQFMMSLRTLGTSVELIWTRIAGEMMLSLKPQLDELQKYLEQHATEITNIGVSIGKAFVDTGASIIKLVPEIDKVVKATIGWRDALELVAAVITYKIFGPIGLLIDALRLAKDAYTGVLKENKDRDDLEFELGRPSMKTDKEGNSYLPGFTFKSLWEDLLNKIDHDMQRLNDTLDKKYGPLQNQSYHPSGGASGDGVTNASYGSGGTVAEPGGPGTIAERHNNPGNLRAAPGAPVSRGFAVFKSALDGFMAMGRQIQLYGQRGVDTVAGVISKWAPPSENNTSAYIDSVARALGVGANDHLNLRDPSTLATLMQSIARIETGKDPWSRNLIDQASRATLGQSNTANRGDVHQQNNTSISVVSYDPLRAAQEVAVKQRGVYSDYVRHLRGAAVYA